MRLSHSLTALPLAALASFAFGQKKPLDHSVYDGWKSISSSSLSRDGKWLAVVIAPQEGDRLGTLRSTAEGRTISIPRASAIQFSRDGKFALATVPPPIADVRKATRDKVKPEDQPKGALTIVELGTGSMTTIERVSSFSLPQEDSGWFAYRLEPSKTTPTSEKKPAEKPSDTVEDQRRGGQGRPGSPGQAVPSGTAPTARGATYILRQLATGKEERIEFVETTVWDKSGTVFAYTLAADKDGNGSEVVARNPSAGWTSHFPANVEKAKFPRIALSEDGKMIAFTTNKDDIKAKKPALSLYLAPTFTMVARVVPIPNSEDSVNEGATIRFTPSGKRLIFSTSPKPTPDPAPTPDEDKVSVDIWTYKDPEIMPQQLLRANSVRNRGYSAIFDVSSGKSKQIERPGFTGVNMGDRGDGRYGFLSVNDPYKVEATYDPGYEDLYVVDLASGEKRLLTKRFNGSASLSPDGTRLALYRGDTRVWTSVDMATGKESALSEKIPFPIYNELNDTPNFPGSYGLGGWTKDGKVIVRDKYDLWLCDPKDASSPQRLTYGRAADLSYKPVDLDDEAPYVNVDDLALEGMIDRTKDSGLYWRRGGKVERLVQGDRKYTFSSKADAADTLLFTRQDVTEYPDLWVTNTRFEQPTKVTEANPQQKDYNWLKSELVTWTSSDGIPLQGILYKPEDFDYGKKYPMISYFYERRSEELHLYKAPAPSASSINIPLFVSQGYLVFVPDIPYKVGDPGLSALNAIVPGVNSIISRGYVDPKRLGIQGQSWGGYQVAHLITVTNMFAAAEAGAPVVDMFSAYGGVRYGTGILRQMQYEHQQSRIGGTPWDSFTKYVENSPLFRLDRVQTPLMIMSNDKDGAVPHTQGIEFYSAMRRLGKPCWMVVYNGEDHNIVERKNRKDFSIRISQYFDHFLKGAPMPVWMKDGVPAVDKGRTMGTELTKP